MQINWDIKNPVVPTRRARAWRWFIGKLTYGGVPLHMSDHYHRDHFHPDNQGKLF